MSSIIEQNYKERVLDTLIDYMEEHTDFARRQITKLGLLGDRKYKDMWDELASQLNALGKIETVQKWQNYWKDLRLKTKQKMSTFLANERSTGNLEQEMNLTEYDVRISSIFGKYGTGVSVFPEIGITHLENQRDPLKFFEIVTHTHSTDKKKGKNHVKEPAVETVTREQMIQLILFMVENIHYALDEEKDVGTKHNLNNELVVKLNACDGPKKDIFGWKTLWDNMRRHCDSPLEGTANEFVTLVSDFTKISKRNTIQRTNALKNLLHRTRHMKSAIMNEITAVKVEPNNDNDEVITLDDDDDTPSIPSRQQSYNMSYEYSMPSTSGQPTRRHSSHDSILQPLPAVECEKKLAFNYNMNQNKNSTSETILQRSAISGDYLNIDILKAAFANDIQGMVKEEVKKTIESRGFMQMIDNLAKEHVPAAVNDYFQEACGDQSGESQQPLHEISNVHNSRSNLNFPLQNEADYDAANFDTEKQDHLDENFEFPKVNFHTGKRSADTKENSSQDDCEPQHLDEGLKDFDDDDNPSVFNFNAIELTPKLRPKYFRH